MKYDINDLIQNEDMCLEYLAAIKWKNGFVCRKCGHTNTSLGKVPHSRRCTRCKNEESATAGTILHNIKFPINKAFYMLYSIYSNSTKVSILEFSKHLDLRQLTVVKFVTRIENRLTRMTMLNTGTKPGLEDFLLGSDKLIN
jgi:two-component system, sensor histidine kinase LadS